MNDLSQLNEVELRKQIEMFEDRLENEIKRHEQARRQCLVSIKERVEAIVELKALRNAKARCVRLAKKGFGSIDFNCSQAVWIDPPGLPSGDPLYANEEDDPYYDNHYCEYSQYESDGWIDAELRLKVYQSALLAAVEGARI